MDKLLKLKVQPILDKDLVLFSWMMFIAVGMNTIFGTVKVQAGEIIIATTTKMLVLFVQVRCHPMMRSICIFYGRFFPIGS